MSENIKTGCQRHIILFLVVLYLFKILHLHVEALTAEEISKLSSRSVLMYIPMSSRSHQNIFRPYAEALAERGHHVTMVVPDNAASKPSGHAKDYLIPYGTINEIRIKCDNIFTVISSLSKDISSYDSSSFFRILMMFKGLKTISRYIRDCHIAVLSHFEIREILQQGRKKFDLVIVSALCNEIGYFLAHKLNAPMILLLPGNLNPVLTLAMGYSDNPAFVSWYLNNNGQNEQPGFLTRLTNFVLFNTFGSIKKFMWMDIQRDILHDLNLLNDGVDLLQLERNASFGMYFTHYLFDAVRPTLPNTVDIGFIQCRPPRKLENDLADWFDKADGKVVYISIGSILTFESIDVSIQKAVTDIFVETKYRFLLKSSTFQPNQPNVKTCVWCPQQDILGHPKTALFISPGGSTSIQEALYHGVPVLILPHLIVEGLSNARRAERQGYGLALNISLDQPVDEISRYLLHMIDTMLDKHANYTQRAIQLGNLARDDIRTPAEKAVFWSEYVMRHAGADHMKSPARNMSFFYFFNVDIFLVFAVASLLFLLILFCATRAILTIAWKIALKSTYGIKKIKQHLKQD